MSTQSSAGLRRLRMLPRRQETGLLASILRKSQQRLAEKYWVEEEVVTCV